MPRTVVRPVKKSTKQDSLTGSKEKHFFVEPGEKTPTGTLDQGILVSFPVYLK